MFFGEYKGEKVVSPDGRYEAQIHESNCGATCPFGTEVRLRTARTSGHRLPFVGGSRNVVFFSEFHPCTVVPYWSGPRHLVIAYRQGDAPDLVLRQKPGWRDVEITYSGFSDEHQPPVDIGGCYEEGFSNSFDATILYLAGGFSFLLALLGGSLTITLRKAGRLRW